MSIVKKRKVFRRGIKTIELPFLLSCALFLLDRRFWILGIRHPLPKTRFDLLAAIPSMVQNVMLVEAKYRGDGRTIRPSEIVRFAREVARVKTAFECRVTAAFMTNTGFSESALAQASKRGIRTFPNVPSLFELRREEGEEEKSKTRKKRGTPNQPSSSNVSNRAGRRGAS